MNIFALVVLYKNEPMNSESLVTLSKQDPGQSVHVFVWDNSPYVCSDLGRKWLQGTFASSEYYHCPENWSLAKIYSYIISSRMNVTPRCFDYLLLLDQDSNLPKTFLEVARRATCNGEKVDLFIPNVFSHGHLISPAHLIYFKGRYLKRRHVGLLNLHFKTAINSGMLISAKYLSDKFTGYHEKLSFYGTDDWFCQRLSAGGGTCFVLDIDVDHDLSQYQEESVDTKLWRHREIIRATRIINEVGRFRRWCCYFYTLLVSVRKALEYRDRRFLEC